MTCKNDSRITYLVLLMHNFKTGLYYGLFFGKSAVALEHLQQHYTNIFCRKSIYY